MTPAYCNHGVKTCAACDELISAGIQADKDRIAELERYLEKWKSVWRNQRAQMEMLITQGLDALTKLRFCEAERDIALARVKELSSPEPPK